VVDEVETLHGVGDGTDRGRLGPRPEDAGVKVHVARELRHEL
jgi:hypothetical protein